MKVESIIVSISISLAIFGLIMYLIYSQLKEKFIDQPLQLEIEL